MGELHGSGFAPKVQFVPKVGVLFRKSVVRWKGAKSPMSPLRGTHFAFGLFSIQAAYN